MTFIRIFGFSFAALLLSGILAYAVQTNDRGCFPLASGSCAIIHIPTGPHCPATCKVGDLYLDNDTSDDANCATVLPYSLCFCADTDTWRCLEATTSTTSTSTSTSTTSTT